MQGLPASVTMRLARDARDAPRARRLLCSAARTARDRGDEGDTGATRTPDLDASRLRCSERGAAIALVEAGTIGTDTEPRKRTGRPSRFIGESRYLSNEGSWRGSKAPGRVGHRLAETAVDGTDSTTEQSLEGELDAGGAQKGGSGNANPGGVSSAAGERQEGSGPGDRVRLMSSGILRGVGTARERDRRPGNRSDEPETR
jgi:hypothetical protein